jgi:hypothetical protein
LEVTNYKNSLKQQTMWLLIYMLQKIYP